MKACLTRQQLTSGASSAAEPVISSSSCESILRSQETLRSSSLRLSATCAALRAQPSTVINQLDC